MKGKIYGLLCTLAVQLILAGWQNIQTQFSIVVETKIKIVPQQPVVRIEDKGAKRQIVTPGHTFDVAVQP